MTPREQAEIAIQEIREHLANCRQSPVDPNLILADRRDVAERIDRLEQVVWNVLDEYEAIQEQRGEMEREARRESERIISAAESRADDVYAASIIYTDNMIGALQTIVDDTNDSLNGVIRRFRKEMRRQKDQLKKNETELQAELINMKDSKKYLQMIEDVNEEREERIRLAKLKAEGIDPEAAKAAATAATAAQAGKTFSTEKADVQINKDAAYFKWKEATAADTVAAAAEEQVDADIDAAYTGGQAADAAGAAQVADAAGAAQGADAAGAVQAAAGPAGSATAAAPQEPDDKTRFVDVEEGLTWQMERKQSGEVDLEKTQIFRPVSREQVRLEREEISQIDTDRLPDEDMLMKAMLQGEEATPGELNVSAGGLNASAGEPDDPGAGMKDFVDDADNFEYYDDDLGDLDGLDELDDFDDFDDFDDYDDFDEDEDFEPGVVGKQVAGKIKDFLLGK